MNICLTQKQMQQLESDSIHNIGIPSLVLMERAALAVVDCVVAHVSPEHRIYILCGMGNNGADGIATGRLLCQRGYDVTLITIGDANKASQEYRVQAGIANNMNITFLEWDQWTPQKEDWIIDGIFGIGLTRDIQGDYRSLIEKIQQTGTENIIAIDIPSGISADTGMILGCALKCKYTITFGYSKCGLYLNQGPLHRGEVIIPEIGFHYGSLQAVDGPTAKILGEQDIHRIPTRREDSNKGTYGRLLIVAGSVGMSGAAYLSALAAYRMGAGLVKILTVTENVPLLQAQLPEAIIQGYDSHDLEEMITITSEACSWATHVIMGPGLGQEPYVKTLVETVLHEVALSQREFDQTSLEPRLTPMVLDSDALNTIARFPELCTYLGPHIVITPHMKEMSRLTNLSISELKANPILHAQGYSNQHHVTCVLKDSTTVITDDKENLYLTISGNSALAKAGTGDVLTGIIGGCTCLGMSPIEAAAYGSYLHGRAGTLASEVHGKHGVLASELTNFLHLA